MKKLFIAFIAAASFLGSCSEDNTTDGAMSTDNISISGGGEINAGPDGVTTELKVVSSGDWRLAGLCDWARPSAASGKNGDVVTFSVDPNPTQTAREATFKFFTGSAVAVLKVSSLPVYELEMLSEREYNFDQSKHSLEIKLHTNIPDLNYAYTENGEQWIRLDSRSEGFGATSLSFTVAANTTYDNRASVITISGRDLEPIQVTVNQKQTDVILPEKPSYSFGLDGGLLEIKMQANIAYRVEVPAKYTWIHYQQKQATSGSRALVDATESFTIDPAMGVRSGKINFKAVEGLYSFTVNILQSGDKHVYATIPDVNFRSWLEKNDFVIVVNGQECELTYEGTVATKFSCESQNIESFEGIEAFSNLTVLECNYNPVKNIPLKDLNISEIDLNDNWKTTGDLVVSGTKLVKLDVYYNEIETLDVSGCPVLDNLNISRCSYLKTLYIKAGQTFTTFNDSGAGAFTDARKYQKVEK